ncbi:hypothetical protein O99_00239 [Bartonella rochalimae ATCC BAA-1498]|uniref:Uncharacterized protein n=1 Tax=Bartonella rochalimae ATCC BAA-1498 TaxID=685782 RepID=E6YLS4_9HYPH|nr:hypothetical protein O99_00239 [Bartonella rochalimae ATCC BAA-1498]CBI77826.1 hypothetical protein BARRO_50175 [Bartonella rochalimae ATCC BAA-1498]
MVTLPKNLNMLFYVDIMLLASNNVTSEYIIQYNNCLDNNCLEFDFFDICG